MEVSVGNQVDCMRQVPQPAAQGSTEMHLTALSLVLLQFWKAAATAVALKRIIILPKFLCFCDELWMYALEDKEDVKCKYAAGVLCGCLLAASAGTLRQIFQSLCPGGFARVVSSLPSHCGGCLWPAEGRCTACAHCALTACNTPGTGPWQMSRSAATVSCHPPEGLTSCRLPGSGA